MEMIDPFVFRLSIFVLAIFVGYFVVWGVTPALHTPLMSVTNAISSVIVDLAAEQGGNTPLSKANEVIEVYGVTIMGYTNLPSRLAVDSSSLYARNLFNFISLLVDKKTGQLAIDWNDEIVKGALVAKDGDVVHPAVKS